MNRIISVSINRVNSSHGFIVMGDFDIKYKCNSIAFGTCAINYIEDDFKTPDDRDIALNKLLNRITKVEQW